MKKKLGLILSVFVIGIFLSNMLNDALSISNAGWRMTIYDVFMMLWGGILSLSILWSLNVIQFIKD